jgi:hypothetical protein
MAPPTFVQESRLGRTIYQIREGVLAISISRWTGFEEHQVDLRRLDPNYEPKSIRLYGLLILPGVGLLISALAYWGLYHQPLVPREAMVYFFRWPIIGIAVSLILAIRGSRRFEFYQFKNHWGKPALSILREHQQKTECDFFMSVLVSHIELAQSDLSPDEKSRILERLLRDETPAPQTGVGADQWMLSISLGVVACGLPLIPGANQYLDLFMFMIVFGLCVGSASLCVLSYVAKETKRHWSIIGLVLSLIPPFFY